MVGSPSEAQRISFLLSGSQPDKGATARRAGVIRVSPDRWASPRAESTTASAPEETKVLRAGGWKVAGPHQAIGRLAEDLANADFAARAIAEVNEGLLARGGEVRREEWYGYYANIRDRASEIALDRIVSALGSVAPHQPLEILLPEGLADRFRSRHPDFSGSVVTPPGIGRLAQFRETVSRWGYSLVRAVLGLARLVWLRLGRRTGEENRILVARSDVYRRLEGAWGDPNTASLVAMARSEGRHVIEICYPHTGGARWQNLWQFVNDPGCLSFEGAYVAARMARPLARDSRLDVARRASELVLRAARPGQAFVSGEYSRLRKALVEEARKSGVTVAGMQHGVIHSRHPGYTFPSGILAELKPDYFLSHGKAYVEVLRRIGYAEDTRVLCAGHPTMPPLPTQPLDQDDLDDGLQVVLITSQPTSRHDIRRALTTQLPADMEEYLSSHVRCIVKLHPSFERLDGFYEMNVSRYPFREFRVEHVDADLFDLFRSCDLHVSFTSTCLQEALAMGIPCLELLRPPQEFSFSHEFGSYLPDGLLHSAEAGGLLAAVVERLRMKGRQRLSSEDVARCRTLFAAPLRLEEALTAVTAGDHPGPDLAPS